MMSPQWRLIAPLFLLTAFLCLIVGCLTAATRKDPAGASLPDHSVKQGYHSRIEQSAEHEKWVQVDLGAVHQIDEVTLIPATPDAFASSSDIGFPPRFIVEIATLPNFKDAELIAELTAGDFLVPDGEPFQIVVNRQPARYVRVTAKKLAGANSHYFFALGEIQVKSGGKNIAEHAKVTALDSMETDKWSKDYLVDGHYITNASSPSGNKDPKNLSRR